MFTMIKIIFDLEFQFMKISQMKLYFLEIQL